jgi:hypothetical protein
LEIRQPNIEGALAPYDNSIPGGTQVSNLQTIQIRLDELCKMRWSENPKNHADDLIEESVRKFGFNDPPEVDTTHRLLVVGHGELKTGKEMMSGFTTTGELEDLGIFQIKSNQPTFS